MDEPSELPLMRVSDVVESLAGWGLKVEPDQLQRPTPEVVEAIFVKCLQHIMGIDLDILREQADSALGSLAVEERELHREALERQLLVYHLSRLAERAKLYNFSHKDLSHPTPKRLLRVFTALINYFKFIESFCYEKVMQLRAHSDALGAQREKTIESIASLKQRIDELKSQIAADQPRCDALQAECDAIRKQLFAMKEAQRDVFDENDRLKKEKQALVGRMQAINTELASVADAITHTQARIVPSPDRIRRAIEEMGAMAAEDKRTVAANEAKARDLQAKANALLVIEQDVRGCVEVLQGIERQVQALQTAREELAATKDALHDREVERRELELRRQRVQQQLLHARERLDHANEWAAEKRAAHQRALDRLQREMKEVAEERRENDKESKALRDEADAIENKMNEHLKKSEAELNELLTAYWEMRHSTNVYMEMLASKLRNPRAQSQSEAAGAGNGNN
ncbi:hypothetical protein FISHEDRAFT_43077 [Fistulina hepatica ATCC 64428]|uniref:Uncharacterized protein n=1 Tax=Fistulina hepatica ATCC 64428 TaxID=1128425 RepID=A0A0D7AC88_9AGAR|nr:hypothetical protein FISHEDRAFT_43077 [Fistulina hepatica ATCC 64428]